ncbi:tetratricopeptide repeat protein [Synechococcus sp. CS-1326]|uniref:tetratricopeptide repeat protein n=1 Tax=Synechococcus sp. CS-1326 TaxID=2847978 RepID=UPI00223B0C44|nr:tetratricopeptide repeat protein [Synechococcus sp. CS-1326]MCT0213651.1 tetratricopeptide repeat protein [Synechococcus sp. CS-1326]
MQATSFTIEETTFDRTLLPEDSRKPGSAAFHRAVTDYFQQAYGAMDGRVDVVFANGRIEVNWSPATESAAPTAEAMAAITPLLKQRRYGEARPLLVALLEAEPENRDALYNLGMLASDEGQLKEARELLRRAVAVDPSFANAQVALGVAALRDQDQAEARQSLERAIELEPGNPYALRTLGSLLTAAGALAAGAERFRQTLAVAPNDAVASLSLAQALLELDPGEHRDEADALLLRVIEQQPFGELGEQAKALRGQVAARDLRQASSNGLRQDAVTYCLDALRRFQAMDQAEFMAVISEVAAVGQSGLQINEPGTNRTLKTLPGSWSDLALACLIHVGMKRLTPDEDSGLGIETEYVEALRLHGGEGAHQSLGRPMV